MLRYATIFAVAFIAAIQPTQAHTDPWGLEYPAVCNSAALAAVHIPVVRVSQAFLDRATHAENRFGVYLPTGAAAVRDDLADDLLTGVIEHERCHHLMKLLTGSPVWHK